MRRLWPGGLAGRLVLVLLAALTLVAAVRGAWFVLEGGERARALVQTTTRQMVATTRLYERVAPADRPLVLEAASHPLLQVQAGAAPAVTAGADWREAPPWLAERVRRRLAPLGARELEVHLRRSLDGDAAPAAGEGDGEVRDLDLRERRGRGDDARGHGRWHRDHGGFEPSRRRLAVSVPVTGGGWLTYVIAWDLLSPVWILRTLALAAVTVIAAVAATAWAAWRLAAPFRRFAAAADRLGTDLDAPPLAETGTGELRAATRAFNRMQERLKRLVEDRTMMLAAISHDLRTVLTRLRLRTELIDDDAQRAKAEADLDAMQAMVEGTLAYARGEAMAEERVELDLAALLSSLVDDRADAGAELAYEGPDRLVVQGRPSGLRRLFANLLDNAERYAGGAVVRLVETAASVTVRVEDAGPGVPDDAREALFAPFRRLEGSRSRATGGTGLGLAVARSIARAHGGEITLEHREPHGLAAVVTLPRR